MTTYYCREHPSFEGTDFAKVHDHLDKDHPELKEAKDKEEYMTLLKKIHSEQLWTINGVLRQSDKAWFKQTWGRPPKLGNLIADNDMGRKNG